MRVGVVLGLTPSPSKAIPDDEVRQHWGCGMAALSRVP